MTEEKAAVSVQTEASVLEGAFVRLRPLRPEDAAVTHAWRLGERARYLTGAAASVEDQARWIAGRPAGEFNFMIELLDGTPIGMLSLIHVDLANRRAESARFLIGDEAAARGVPAAVEAMSLLYELAFERLGLERVHGVVEARNQLMIKWQKHLGMQEEGRFRRHFMMDGEFRDAVALGLLADEYRTVAAPRIRGLIRLGRGPAGERLTVADARREEVQRIILEALENLNQELEEDARIEIGPGTALFGPNARLDSLSLVSVIVDVETGLTVRWENPISLTDDRAMSREVSPFDDVGTLTGYILELLQEISPA